MEYEEAAKRSADATGLSDADVEDILDYLCSVAHLQEIHFLWRPVLRDAEDDHVLEVAVGDRADFIVTHNVKDFNYALVTTVTDGSETYPVYNHGLDQYFMPMLVVRRGDTRVVLASISGDAPLSKDERIDLLTQAAGALVEVAR